MPTIPSVAIHPASACEEPGAVHGWGKYLIDAALINKSKRLHFPFIELSLPRVRTGQELDKMVSPETEGRQSDHGLWSGPTNRHHFWVVAKV